MGDGGMRVHGPLVFRPKILANDSSAFHYVALFFLN